jgi:hypothetical protein
MPRSDRLARHAVFLGLRLHRRPRDWVLLAAGRIRGRCAADYGLPRVSPRAASGDGRDADNALMSGLDRRAVDRRDRLVW